MDGIDKYFHRTAVQNYSSFLVPALIFPATQQLIKLADLKSGSKVLDVACGTGVVARNVAPTVGLEGKVIGIDIYPEMLDIARSIAEQEGISIEWQRGDVVEMPFEDETFDVALCQQGLQWFPDRLAALQEIGRVLKSGGRLAFSVFTRIEDTPGYAILVNAIQRHAGEEAAVDRRKIFSLGGAAEIRRLLEAAGFRDISIEVFDYFSRFPSPDEFLRQEIASWTIRVTADMDDDTRRAFIDDVRSWLQTYTEEEGLNFPCRTNLALAFKG